MKKTVLIGCGGIGGYHLSHLVQFTDIVNLAGFCDLIAERADGFVKTVNEQFPEQNAKAYTDYRVMLDEIKPDMCFVCVPPNCHGDIERDLIMRGIHFFVEKPLALNMELAHEILEGVEKAHLVTGVGFQCRYSKLVAPNKQFVADNKIVYVNCNRIGGIPGVDWWRKRSTSGGQIVEQTIHNYDIIRYMLGEPDEVFTYGARGFVQMDGYDTEDVSTTVIKFKSGALGAITTGCYATSGHSFDSKITFSASDCRADLHILDKFVVYGVSGEKAEKSGLILANDGSMKASGDGITFREEGDAGVLTDRTFIEGVISGDGSKVRSPYRDAMKSLAFTLACNESIDTGKPVSIANRF